MNASDRRAPRPSAGESITVLLHAAQAGQKDAADALLRAVYAELKIIAMARVRHLPAGQTLGPTALVHEAYEKLFRDGEARFASRAHFFGAAAQAMRDLLVDHARHKAAQKRGGDQERAPEEALDALPVTIDLPFDRQGRPGAHRTSRWSPCSWEICSCSRRSTRPPRRGYGRRAGSRPRSARRARRPPRCPPSTPASSTLRACWDRSRARSSRGTSTSAASAGAWQMG
ncbi:ECF-type sigma factor [Sorangium sp. So ce513]|uniref:ECF-type sigma factor n=1 Tax=Sorangium sp. So ce513 TaxID=3133315 RepID=UPI003F62912B